jgi:prepilin-type N-terminal cleavage/methylation domain-containing protein
MLIRGGFTLIELLVSLIVLAVVVVAILPGVVQQVNRADPVRVAHDLTNVRTAIDLFHLQSRAYPRRLDHLITRITASDSTAEGTLYTARQVAGWAGPYLATGLSSPGANIGTAGDVQIQNSFALFRKTDTFGSGSVPPILANYIAVKTTTMTAATFEAVNDIIDGEAEPDGWGAGKSMQTGLLRLVPAFPPLTPIDVTGITFYLAAPYP